MASGPCNGKPTHRIVRVVVLFAAGGLVAFPFGLFVARFLSMGRSAEVAFASCLLALATATIGITSLIFAFDYRTYYAEWHDDAFSIRLVFEITFTTLSAMYQFAVLGIRLYFPVGFAALLVASLWFARRAH